MNLSLANIFRIPELRKRILVTIGLLAVYRLGIFVSTPGVDRREMAERMGAGEGGFLGLYNLFSGGALEQMSVFALGIMPYISASIVVQLLGLVYPPFERLQKEGEPGRRKLNQYTRYGTIVLALVQGVGIAGMLVGLNAQEPGLLVTSGPWFYFVTVVALTTGTAFLMWLGEQITERGIGNGISLIIFAGIVAGLVPGAFGLVEQVRSNTLSFGQFVMLVVVMLTVMAGVVFFERSQRRIPVQSARGGGRRLAAAAGNSSYLPLKINTSGVIPPIFAGSILLFPASVASWFPSAPWSLALSALLDPMSWSYNTVYVVLIVFFCFFYTAVTFNTVDVADNMRRQNSFIPGIRPGKMTAEYIDRVLTRLTAGGAVYLSAVCVLPVVLLGYFGSVTSMGGPFFYGGTSLLIVVSVGLDTVQQIEGYLIPRNDEDQPAAKSGRIRDRVEDPSET